MLTFYCCTHDICSVIYFLYTCNMLLLQTFLLRNQTNKQSTNKQTNTSMKYNLYVSLIQLFGYMLFSDIVHWLLYSHICLFMVVVQEDQTYMMSKTFYSCFVHMAIGNASYYHHLASSSLTILNFSSKTTEGI